MTTCTGKSLPTPAAQHTAKPLLTSTLPFEPTATHTALPTQPNRSLQVQPGPPGEVTINPDYIEALNEVYTAGLRAAQNPANVAWQIRSSLYAKIKHMTTLVEDPQIKAQTERLLVDFKIGLELMDERPIKKALESIQEIRQMLE